MNQAVALIFLAVGACSETVVRNAFSLKRGGAAKEMKTEEQKPKHGLKIKSEEMHTYAEHEVEVWYINQAKRTDRRDCMERQLLDLGITPHRFEALEPKKEDLSEGGKYQDCVKGGFGKKSIYIDATAGGISSGEHTKMAIIGNTCSHKRLFQQLAASNSTAKYFIVLEDDAILNPLKFKTAINQFVDEQWGYKGAHAKDFQLVQLDFIGSFCKDHQVGKFGGKRVFKPKNIFQPGVGGADCSRYFGAQALLVQKDTLPSVVEHMESHKTLPMDWYQGDLPRALAWRPQIARSPIQKFNKLPEFCSKKTRTSSISLKGGETTPKGKHSAKLKTRMPREQELDTASWVESFKTEAHTDDASDDAKDEE